MIEARNNLKVGLMELKKNPEVDLYRFRNVFFNLGLAISIAAVFAVFQFKTYDDAAVMDLGDAEQNKHEIIDIPPTTQPPPPPPKIKLPEIVEISNEELIMDDIDLNLDIEMHQDTRIDDVEFNDDLDAEAPEEEEADKIFMIVEQDAEPEGGIKAFYAYVANQLQDNYPRAALRMNIEGIVYLQFVIEKDGTITQVEAVKGIGGGCDELAKEVLENSPKWKPARQRGVAVRSRKVIPIRFMLANK